MLHLTNGDHAADRLRESGIGGEVLAWRDVLYEGLRSPGWPDERALATRATFLAGHTGGGLTPEGVLDELRQQYRILADAAAGHRPIVLWFDACLFDQAMLAHVLACLLACLAPRATTAVELLVIDEYPGIERYHGLGQLSPAQLAGCFDRRQPITDGQFHFAVEVERAFASQDASALAAIAQLPDAPLPWMPAAAARWLREQPDPVTGLGHLETLALTAIRGGCEVPSRIFAEVSAADTPPQFWGDTTLWARINGLADRQPAPLVTIAGPAARLPQWGNEPPVDAFTVRPHEEPMRNA